MKGCVFRPRCSTLSRVRRHELLEHDPKPFFLGMSRLIVIACLAAGAWGLIVEGNLSAAPTCGIKRSSLYKRDGRFVDWEDRQFEFHKSRQLFHPRAQRNAFRRPDVRLANWTFDRERMPRLALSCHQISPVITAVVSKGRETRNRGIFGSNPRGT